jgi:phosphoribosylamine--glycine ligase
MINKIFAKYKKESDSALRGVPLYVAFMHTSDELKILETNSRAGDPEIINILPLLKDDFVDVCFKMIHGNLTNVDIETKASVVTYSVPPGYGGFADAFPNRVSKADVDGPVDLNDAYKLSEQQDSKLRIYTGSMESRDYQIYALRSRAVCAVGIADTIDEARKISLGGVAAIKGGSLWHRNDIASEEHISKSLMHIHELRQQR